MPNKKLSKILIAEDEKTMSKALDLKLQKSGFKTRVAYDGEQALEFLAKEKFDLLLLDLMMPKKDGFSVLSEMLKKNDKTPVIVSTNLSQMEDMARAQALGAKDYFIKSDTSIAEVVGHVKRLLAS